MVPSFNGELLFGECVNCVHVPNEAEFQQNAYFGAEGRTTLAAGTRGRTFRIRGLLVAPSIEVMNALEDALESYNDGRAYTFVDTRGRIWPSVQYRGGYKPDDRGFGVDSDGNYTLAYELILHGLR